MQAEKYVLRDDSVSFEEIQNNFQSHLSQINEFVKNIQKETELKFKLKEKMKKSSEPLGEKLEIQIRQKQEIINSLKGKVFAIQQNLTSSLMEIQNEHQKICLQEEKIFQQIHDIHQKEFPLRQFVQAYEKRKEEIDSLLKTSRDKIREVKKLEIQFKKLFTEDEQKRLEELTKKRTDEDRVNNLDYVKLLSQQKQMKKQMEAEYVQKIAAQQEEQRKRDEEYAKKLQEKKKKKKKKRKEAEMRLKLEEERRQREFEEARKRTEELRQKEQEFFQHQQAQKIKEIEASNQLQMAEERRRLQEEAHQLEQNRLESENNYAQLRVLKIEEERKKSCEVC